MVDSFPPVSEDDWCGEWADGTERVAPVPAAAVDWSNAFSEWETPKPAKPQPVAWCIQCADDDPKVHSLSFDKAALGKIVTRHGGKVVPLYLGGK